MIENSQQIEENFKFAEHGYKEADIQLAKITQLNSYQYRTHACLARKGQQSLFVGRIKSSAEDSSKCLYWDKGYSCD